MSELQRDGRSTKSDQAIAAPTENRPIQLMLVDEDPVFRLGLKVWLEQQGDFAVMAEAETAAAAVMQVQTLLTPAPPPPESSIELPELASESASKSASKSASRPTLDLVILDLGLGARDLEATPGLQLCQQIKTDYPTLPVLVLSARAEPVLQAAAEQMGADGYGTRSMPVRQLAQLIRQVASSPSPRASLSENSPLPPSPSPAPPSFSLQNIPGPLTAMRISLRLSGQQQINQALAALTAQRPTSWLKQSILDGKKRELMAARWLISAVWRTPQFDPQSSAGSRNALAADWIQSAQQGGYGQYGDMTAARYLDRDSLVPAAAANLARLQSRPGDVQNVVFEGVFAKLQRPLKNISHSPLEIDILRPDKKLELLYLVLRQLEDLLADLRSSGVKPGQLGVRSSQVVHDLWDAVNTEFFGKYYTVRIGNVEEEVVILLQQEKPLVQAQILDRIPQVTALFGHWLFQEQMVIEGAAYLATTPQAIAYSERLLENLMIQVANAVMQPLLNRLADSEPIKKSLYSTRLMSSREIERFRNDLSWRYRWDRLVNEPKAIFESRYNLHVLTPSGIDITAIYAPRRAELDRLSGIPLVVTVALETRDAISPRLRTAISLIGSSVVYVLTEVVGRGIGLVGRGILQGVGSAWQETKGTRRRPKNSYGQPDNPYPEDPYSPDLNEWE